MADPPQIVSEPSQHARPEASDDAEAQGRGSEPSGSSAPKPRGFATLSPERRRELAARGGVARQLAAKDLQFVAGSQRARELALRGVAARRANALRGATANAAIGGAGDV